MIFKFLRWNDAITEANQRVLIPPHNVKLIKWSFVETLRSFEIWKSNPLRTSQGKAKTIHSEIADSAIFKQASSLATQDGKDKKLVDTPEISFVIIWCFLNHSFLSSFYVLG